MIRGVLFDLFETLITHYRTPLYFSAEIARDMDLPLASFRELWRGSESARSTGLSLEDCLAGILQACGRERDDALIRHVVRRRLEVKRACFAAKRPDMLPMLSKLRSSGIRTGLVSNCFSEEALALRESDILPRIDAAALSFEEGVEKPDPEIFLRCLARLGLGPEECIYVGDGGSRELEAASALGMRALQAVWYFADNGRDTAKEKGLWPQLGNPEDLFRFLEEEGTDGK